MSYPFQFMGGDFPNNRTFQIDKTGLKAYYKFNETSGDIINQAGAVGSSDSLGSAADLQTSGVTYNQSIAPFGYSLSWDGVNDTAIAGSSTSQFNFMHNTSAKFTVVVWANDKADASPLMDDTNGGGTNIGCQIISVATRAYRSRIVNAGGAVMTKTTTNNFIPDTTTMHMYVFTYDQSLGSSNYTVSIDNGTPETANKTANPPVDTNSTTAMKIGCGGGFFFNGKMAEMQIWNRILSASEITSIYNGGSGVTL